MRAPQRPNLHFVRVSATVRCLPCIHPSVPVAKGVDLHFVRVPATGRRSVYLAPTAYPYQNHGWSYDKSNSARPPGRADQQRGSAAVVEVCHAVCQEAAPVPSDRSFRDDPLMVGPADVCNSFEICVVVEHDQSGMLGSRGDDEVRDGDSVPAPSGKCVL